MEKTTWALTLGTPFLAAMLLVGCGGSTSSNNTSQETNTVTDTEEGVDSSAPVNVTQSYIPYLRTNHANYKEHGSNQVPAPVKDANNRSINWTIAANTEEGAVILFKHIHYMKNQLKADQNPRGWDKLFLMEAYMKYNKYYTTNIERSGTNVVVSKNANTACAYEVISAHSDAVSGDFFAQGNIMVNYSAKAEAILASSACNDVRTSLTNYIASRRKRRGR